MFVLKRLPKVSLIELRNEENMQNYPKKEEGQTYTEIKIKMSPGTRQVSERSRLGTKEQEILETEANYRGSGNANLIFFSKYQ